MREKEKGMNQGRPWCQILLEQHSWKYYWTDDDGNVTHSLSDQGINNAALFPSESSRS